MSLTTELEAGRPARIYLDRRFGAYLQAARRSLPPDTRVRLREAAVPSPPTVHGGALGTIGTAFDYRARFYFETQAAEPLAAHRGAALWCGRCDAHLQGGEVRRLEADPLTIGLPPRRRPSVKLVRQFFGALNDDLAQLNPIARRLDRKAEKTLARGCLVLALLEQLYRAGNSLWFDSPLFSLRRGARLEDLMALPTAGQVADLCALSRAFFEDEGELLQRAHVCNPSFIGSPLVNGADADLIVADCLLELKTSASIVSFAGWLRQLLGYILLDFDDAYRIRRVAVYAARMRTHVSFDLHQLLGDPEADGQETDFEERLKLVRREFKTVLRTRRVKTKFPFAVQSPLRARPLAKRPRLPQRQEPDFVVLFRQGAVRDLLGDVLRELGGSGSTYDITIAMWERPGAAHDLSARRIRNCLKDNSADFERLGRGVYGLRPGSRGSTS